MKIVFAIFFCFNVWSKAIGSISRAAYSKVGKTDTFLRPDSGSFIFSIELLIENQGIIHRYAFPESKILHPGWCRPEHFEGQKEPEISLIFKAVK